ncbi:HAMP domain-containing sensor histidine kinase [Bacillus thermotolerans]|uniref:sensor histidine kinase n=1 Tax=Bacillus thermotolerans TaxID=1221996 RepID=UPI0005921C8F|nr:HAMP domain-containing sensor histidine kinase [Bacillus thermotolerans]KKB38133.1 Osmosensitive K+ channel histidine kinase KdpD [Bacillus thermotolerans]
MITNKKTARTLMTEVTSVRAEVINKITLKLGLWFFFVMLIVEVCLFFFLHTNMVKDRVEEELTALQARGNSHRDVLEDVYHEDTLRHIAVMEQNADTEVIITDQEKNMIISSSKLDKGEQAILSKNINTVPRNGKVLEQEWRSEKYISTVSPYTAGEQQGYVFMFKSTSQVQDLISRLTRHFLVAGVLTAALLLLTILFLTKSVTTPLIRMKKATEKLSKGDFSVDLPDMGEDELGELSRSITVLARDLKHLKEERSEFLSSISHELRTPLTYIKGYADVARRKNIEGSERDRYLDIIYEESEKLTDMVKDLFDLAKMDQNTFVIHREKVQLCAYLRGICEKMRPAFKEKGIELEADCQEEIHVMIDPLRFEQVFLNLLDNAIKYSDPSAKVTLSVKREKGEVLIEVKDEGRGIPEEHLPFIFERFYRVDKSRSRDLGGTGLGLSIAKELVEANKGRIEVKSEAGKGSTFLIWIEEVAE